MPTERSRGLGPRLRPGYAVTDCISRSVESRRRDSSSICRQGVACDADREESRAWPAAPSGLCGHGLHLSQRGKPPKGFQLDLPYPLAREAEAAADLLERLRLRVVEAVT